MKPTWARFLPKPLQWRVVHLRQHLRIAVLKRMNPAPELAGIRLPIMQDVSNNICEAIYDGYYEAAELASFTDKLTNDDIVLEIGAGIGFLSAFCARRLGPGRVFAYEANPSLEPLIQAVYKANAVLPTLKIGAVGAARGEATFYVKNDFWASSLLRPEGRFSELRVPVYDVNAEILAVQPTFLIMDIEGGEYDLIRSIQFRTIQKLSLELHIDVLGQQKTDEMKRILDKAGFVEEPAYSLSEPGVKEVLFLERRQ